MNLSGELNLKEIESVNFPSVQYFQQQHKKTQIVLHHSAGYDNARNMFAGWATDKPRVATCCGVVDSGKIYQAFSSKYWAWHVNIARNKKAKKDFPQYHISERALNVEHRTIGVEVCNWGPLMKDREGRFHTWASKPGRPITLPEEKVIEYPGEFRGSMFYERYTDAEIETLYKLVKYWGKIYDIPTKVGDPLALFQISEDALKGTPGIYTHCSYREDKSDLHPQKEVLQMLSAL